MTTTRARRRLSRLLATALALVAVAASLTACLGAPGDTSKITLASTRTVDGWKYDYYLNTAYPCAISGYQTFVVGTKVGSAASAQRPLWVKMHGGGVGWFGTDGKPLPNAGQKTQESFDQLLGQRDSGLTARAQSAPQGFRLLIVSMCSHDVYGGTVTPDPYNPNTTPDGGSRPTSGLIATKAAIQFTEAAFPTSDFILHGTSAGGFGVFNVAWGLQQQGAPATAIVSDSGVLDQQWEHDVVDQGISGSAACDKASDERSAAVAARIDPALVDPANQPDLLVSRRELTVPIAHVWNHGDQNSCGNAPMTCHLRNGSTVQLTAADCRHENLRRAVAAEGPTSRSINVGVCVEGKDTTQPCDRHVVTSAAGATNSDPTHSADFQQEIWTWVLDRLADD